MNQEFIDKKLKYIQDSGLSYSRFKNFEYHPSTIFKDKDLKYSNAMDIGSVLDLLLQQKEIIVKDIKPITGLMGNFIEKLSFELKEGMDVQEIEEIKTKCYNEIGFKQKDITSILSKFNNTEILEYFNYLKLKQDNFVVTTDIYNKGKELYDIFKEFYKEELENVENFQLDDVFIYNEVKLRAIIDGYNIDYKNNIINIYDFKSTQDFLKSYEKFNYVLQATFYYLYFKSLYPDFEVNFYFLTINTKYNKCEKYKVTQNTLNNNIEIFNNLLEDYKWHIENNKWDFKKSYYEKNYYEL